MKTNIVLFLCLIISACNTIGRNGENHNNIDENNTKQLYADSLYIDAYNTSLAGQWLIKDSILYFVDKYIVGIKLYDLDGQYIGEEVTQGRGPNEMIQPAWISAIDGKTGNMIIMDAGGAILEFDKEFNILYNTQMPWFMMLSEDFGENEAISLLSAPDPNIPEMYEYNFDSNKMFSNNGRIYLPVTTEHIKYNKFLKGRIAKNYWKNSFTFISFNINDISGTKRLFGKYPKIYQRHHIPVFSDYDFAIVDNYIYVTYEADPIIYKYDIDGRLCRTFGVPSDQVNTQHYPTSYSFDDYEINRGYLKECYGYYGRIFADEKYILRTYKRDDGVWMMQQYNHKYDLINIYQIGAPLEIIGKNNDLYYANVGVDLNKECFKLIRFKLN